MKLVFLCDIISCDVINVKNFREIWVNLIQMLKKKIIMTIMENN